MDDSSEGTGRALLMSFAPGIGDTVMMEPLLRASLAARPEWRWTLVAREYAAELLHPGDYELVTPFYYVERAPSSLRPVHRLIPQRLIAWAAESAVALDFGPFDTVINLFRVFESRVPFSRWWTPQIPPVPGVRHTVDILADYLEEELGIQIPAYERKPRLKLFPDAAIWARDYLLSMGAGGRPLASLVVSASNPLKLWAVPKWADLNDRLVRRGWRTLLVATRDDQHARQIFDACEMKPLWPEVGIRQMAALLDRSDSVTGVDTGPLHVAAALGTPWVGLFGATNPDLTGPPDRELGRALLAPFPKEPTCKDCWLAFKNREAECLTLQATGCTVLITVEDVLEATEAVAGGTRIA